MEAKVTEALQTLCGFLPLALLFYSLSFSLAFVWCHDWPKQAEAEIELRRLAEEHCTETETVRFNSIVHPFLLSAPCSVVVLWVRPRLFVCFLFWWSGVVLKFL